jgi:CSLREA domain-containing protein
MEPTMDASRSFRHARSLVAMALLAGLFSRPAPAAAAYLLVNSSNDNDDGRCDARHCSLREAINAANADRGWDRIDFDIPGAGPHTITLGRPLPPVTDNQTWILAASEPDFAGQPVVILDGRLIPRALDDTGLVIESDGNIVRGFSFIRFPWTALEITGSRNEVEGNFMGVAPGMLAAGTCDPYVSGYSNMVGISVASGAGNVVRDNVISCNGNAGVAIGLYPTGTIVQGNSIGTDPTGAYAIPNADGVMVHGSASGTLIGGDEPSDRNLISGNERGVVVFGNDVRVTGNRIGTNAAGDAAIPNEVGLDVRGANHTIGGDGPGQGNLISGNTKGIWIQGEFITVWQNRIGTDAAGAAAVSNGVGIMITGPGNVAIGGPSPILGNLIAHNRLEGIFIGQPRDLNILDNTIHSNGQDGIFVFNGQDVLIEANTIYSNGGAGVRLGASGTLWYEETVQRTTISLNSFYDNGGRAILFTIGFVNGDIDVPNLTSVSRTSAAGTACPGCVVEIFLAARDPSGFGEGKTFLVSVTAGADGAFAAMFPEIRNCETLTATATDADGNTSAFSQNQTVGVCVAPPSPWLTAVVLILGTVGGSAFMPDLNLLPLRLRGALRRLLGGLLGLAAGGAVLGIIALILGNAQARLTEASFPPCSESLNENLTSPPSGAVYEPGTDVLIGLSPQPDPPGSQTQWRFEVTELKAGSRELTRGSPSLRLSELGFDPQIPGEFYWQVSGERRAQGAEPWQTFCQDLGPRLFSIRPLLPTDTAQPPTATSTPAPTPTHTPTPTPETPVAVAHENANCRFGPGTQFDPSAILNQGVTAPIQGRNAESTWWFVLPSGERYGCWVWAGAVETSGDLSGVPVRAAPPTPTPVQGCWVLNQQQQPVCTVPCPANPVPGGTCTP